MSARAKRLTQKDLRQPDEFVSATGRVVDWGRGHQDAVKYGALGLVALLVAIAVGSWWISSRNAEANRQFYAAIELFKAEQWGEAYEGFAALANDLGGTDYGRLANLYAARSALRLERPDDAIRFYGDYLDGPTTVALEQLARLNLARAHLAKGETEPARAELERALELDGPAKPEVVLELARVQDEAGQSAEALALYERYLEDEPQGAARELARARIVALGGTPPEDPTAGFPMGANPLQIQVD